MDIKHILVPIRTLRGARATLRKAAALARSSGADIEIFHAIDEPVLVDPERREPYVIALQRRSASILQKWQQRLEKLAADPDLAGLQVTATAAWDYPAHEAIIRRVNTIHADLVVASTWHHSAGMRLFLANTDWELIRHCPCALLLVRSAPVYQYPKIVAAVDPFQAHAKPADLDLQILRNANSVAGLLGGEAHAFHAYKPVAAISPLAVAQPLAFDFPPEVEEIRAEQMVLALRSLAGKGHIAAEKLHLHRGEVAIELEMLVHKLRADIVVMGAVSRSGLRRVFIGNTAERLLDQLTCDVLVVKPKSFRTSIRGKTPVAAVKRSSARQRPSSWRSGVGHAALPPPAS